MKVKVTPPYEGAGSFEAEAGMIVHDGNIESYVIGGVVIPHSWCEPIPEITPEKGDICEFRDSDTGSITMGLYNGPGDYRLYPTSCKIAWHEIRVLARKPKEWGDDVLKAIDDFRIACSRADMQSEIKAAYETFLRTILGGAEWGRVDK